MTARPGRELLWSMRRLDGWFTLGLVILICATLAWSLDDALLVLGRETYTDFLFWAAIGGVAIGFLGPLAGVSRWTTHLIGAICAAILIPLLVGWVADPGRRDRRVSSSSGRPMRSSGHGRTWCSAADCRHRPSATTCSSSGC